MATATMTRWQLKGQGYEYCNCDFGCGCNFGGFPNSEDGSCRALVGQAITEGRCGDVDLSGVRCAMLAAWPKAIHEGNGKAVFIVDLAASEKQVGALAEIYGGKLGGLPFEILAPTLEVVGLVRNRIAIGRREGRDAALPQPRPGIRQRADRRQARRAGRRAGLRGQRRERPGPRRVDVRPRPRRLGPRRRGGW